MIYIADILIKLHTALEKYLFAFGRLKRGVTKYGLAPHKPVFLISIIELFNKGLISENKLFVNADLVGTFKENWELLVPTQHQPDFTQPFFYLQNDKADGTTFWFLKPQPGVSIDAHIKSVKVLSEVCEYGYFAPELFALLMQPEKRLSLQTALLSSYFSEYIQHFFDAKQKGEGYFRYVESFVLNEPEARIIHVSKHIEEDIFVRGGVFKKEVPRIYSRTCSITGMKIESTYAHTFVDACHIKPFSVSRNDSVTNGIALCPNLHRAFDRGLVSIDNNYKVLVSAHLIEDSSHAYSLKSLEGKTISLPTKEYQYPALENLSWHRNYIFKG